MNFHIPNPLFKILGAPLTQFIMIFLLLRILSMTHVRFKYSQPLMETESCKYGAYILELNGLSLKFRVAKITPSKVGQFVTLWKRIENGSIQPLDVCDPFDFFIVSARKNDYFGQFVFPKTVLSKHGIISKNGKNGKRAMRVYPPWDKTLNRQAQNTQRWQIEYFLEILQDRPIDCARVQMLYSSI